MKVVVLGAGGLLGSHVVEELRGHEVAALARRGCDVTDGPAVARALAGAEVVINCAAYTNVDRAEAEPEAAQAANADGAEQVARAAAAGGARLLHVSTDFVFDGQKAEPYDEDDAPRPLAVYARTKREGELRVLDRHPAATVVRVQGLYGARGGNFASKLAELIARRTPLKLDGERRVQPTWARLAARTLVALAARPLPGIVHLSCAGETTWAGFARVLAARLAVEPAWQEVPTAALGAPAARPVNCCFSHRRLREAGLVPEPWEAALDGYLAERAAGLSRA